MRSRRERSITQTLEGLGYDLVSVRQLGEDPGTHSIRSVVIGHTDCSYSDAGYAVWNCIDWKTAPAKEDRRRGIDICVGSYNLTREEALEEEGMRYTDLMQRYTWLVPGTDKIVPGSRGYR